MQENKFRSWDKCFNLMCEVKAVNWLENTALCAPIIPGKKAVTYRWRDINEFIFMQFTGKQDKNGKDIYENDICRFDCIINKLTGIGLVYWNDLSCCWSAKTTLPFLLHTALVIEVIGNIHENNELLKKQNR
jgi:uncharacterized phage protein (TIGR01671 family)